MRLRLDKLVLSAGLALAMVATTIPVVPVKAADAITVGYYVGTTSSTAASIVEKAKVLETEGKVTRGTNIKITAGTSTEVDESSAVELESVADKVTVYKVNNSCSTVNQITDVKSAITVGQSFTYEPNSINVTISGDINGTEAVADDPETTNKDETVAEEAAVTTERDAAVDAVIAELNGLGIGTFTKGTATTQAPGNTDGYKVTVKFVPTNKKATDYGTVGYTSNTTSFELNVSAVNETTGEATITFARFTVTNTYTITNLAALDASVKIVKTLPADTTDSSQYTLLKVTTDGEIEEVKTVLGASEASELVADVTDLTCAYYIATKTVSTSDKLIASAEDDATYKGVIGQKAKSDLGTTAAEKLAEAIEANSAKLVAYLDVEAYKTDDLVNDLDETPYELTFKIAVPVDVDTTGVVFKVLRYHGSSVDVLDTTVKDGYIYFTTDKFSAYALVTVAADTTENQPQEDQPQEDQPNNNLVLNDSKDDGGSSPAKGSSPGTADNSMMPLFMTTLLLALCAGSLAIYKEKKTN